MPNDTVIKVENLSKRNRIGTKAGRNRDMLEKKNLAEIYQYTTHLSENEQLELISKISARILNQRLTKSKPKSWMDMAGLGAEIWKDVDAQEYIKRERESWEK